MTPLAVVSTKGSAVTASDTPFRGPGGPGMRMMAIGMRQGRAGADEAPVFYTAKSDASGAFLVGMVIVRNQDSAPVSVESTPEQLKTSVPTNTPRPVQRTPLPTFPATVTGTAALSGTLEQADTERIGIFVRDWVKQVGA